MGTQDANHLWWVGQSCTPKCIPCPTMRQSWTTKPVYYQNLETYFKRKQRTFCMFYLALTFSAEEEGLCFVLLGNLPRGVFHFGKTYHPWHHHVTLSVHICSWPIFFFYLTLIHKHLMTPLCLLDLSCPTNCIWKYTLGLLSVIFLLFSFMLLLGQQVYMFEIVFRRVI